MQLNLYVYSKTKTIFLFIFKGILSTTLATKNVTDTKDKRQAGQYGQQHTAVVPIGHNGGPQALVIHQNQRHQPAAQYVAKSIATQGGSQQQQHAEQQQEVNVLVILLYFFLISIYNLI